MATYPRLGLMAVALCLLAGCARAPQSPAALALRAPAARASATMANARIAGVPVAGVAKARPGFASLPDRGELLAYQPQPVIRDGAYTWRRAAVSERYALRAIADGQMRITTPAGQALRVQYDRRIEHPSGDWTWIGHVPGHPELQTILTFGAKAAFGSIAQPGGLPLRLTVRNGSSWLVDTDPRKVAMIDNAATRPQRPDFKVPPRIGVAGGRGAAAAMPRTSAARRMSAATTSAADTVDLVIGYTPGFATANNGTSGATTRLNFLIDVSNAAFGNSSISAQVRLVATLQVNYTDTSSNDVTLEQVTGYSSTTNTSITPDPAFNALRAAREQYGADLVSVVRKYDDATNGGCGIAWLIGGGQSGIVAGDSAFGYSVVSDGSDTGADGKTYYCLDETLVHEMGHNMGAAHDVATAKGTDGVLAADEYGAYPYSFGYKTTALNGNFYTVMAYGDTGQALYRIFSNPRSTFCGGRACGDATTADNARTLTQTAPIIATFRATLVAAALRSDYDGDGRADILWRNSSTGDDRIWRSGDSGVPQAVTTVTASTWRVAGSGDFNSDRKADILWRDSGNGMNVIWLAGNSATQQAVTRVSDLSWEVVGVGDFDGDGRSDILWRNNRTGLNAIWRSGNSTTPQTIAGVGNLAWNIVGVGDFDGDGLSDILWRNASNGINVIWRSGDSSTQQAVNGVSNLAWRVVGVGDFDGDGRSDILWRNASTGLNAIWKSGDASTPQSIIAVANPDWRVAAVADYNADGRSDILWRNVANGLDVIWLGADRAIQQAVTAEPNQAWAVVAG